MKTIADLKKFIEQNSIPDDTPIFIVYENCCESSVEAIDYDENGLFLIE